MRTLPELIGWTGSLLYIVAYLLLCLKKLNADSTLYHLLNILGAVGLIINAFHWNDFPSAAVNFAWLGIGLFAIFLIIRKRRSRANGATR